MFKKMTRQIVVEVRVPHLMSGWSDALRVLAGHFGYDLDAIAPSFNGGAFRRRFDIQNDVEASALVVEAANQLLAYIYSKGQTIERAKQLGVQLVPQSPAEPTWTSQDGTSTRVRDLPTKHLVNILSKYAGCEMGVLDAIRDELRKRERGAA